MTRPCKRCGYVDDPLTSLETMLRREAEFKQAHPRVYCPNCKKRLSVFSDAIVSSWASEQVAYICDHCDHRFAIPHPSGPMTSLNAKLKVFLLWYHDDTKIAVLSTQGKAEERAEKIAQADAAESDGPLSWSWEEDQPYWVGTAWYRLNGHRALFEKFFIEEVTVDEDQGPG